MNATNWRVDIIGGDRVRVVLWDKHWTTEFEPSDVMLAEMVGALKLARQFTARGYALYGGVESTP